MEPIRSRKIPRWRVAVCAVVVMALPIAVAPAAGAGSGPHGVTATATDEVSAGFAELRQLIDQHVAGGGVTFSGAARMDAPLDLAEFYYGRGLDQRAVLALGTFKQAASDPVRVPSLTARQELLAAADELIAALS